jgi:hypothetical protein
MTIFFYVLFALMQKERKKSSPARTYLPVGRAPPAGRASAHDHSLKIANALCYCAEDLKSLLRAIRIS